MTELVSWGVMGTANIARKCVIPAILKSKNGSLRAIASRSLDRAQMLAQEHKVFQAYGSYEALLADPTIDAVYIPLPNHLHLVWTLRALAAGKHVLCEKPLALTAIEAQQMVDMAHKADLHLMEAFMYRFHPRSQLIKQLVDEYTIGSLRLVRAAFSFKLNPPGNIRLQPEMGGGALLDVGCYGVSLARWLLGTEPKQVQAQAIYGPNGVDLNFAGILRFGEEQLAIVEASFVSALQQTYTLIGSDGAIELPHDAFIPWEKEAIFYQRGINDEVGIPHRIPGVDQYQLMVEHFAEVVLGQIPPGFDPQDSINNLRVLDGLRQAAIENRTITLSPS
jgi:predicted dehydrogenase